MAFKNCLWMCQHLALEAFSALKGKARHTNGGGLEKANTDTDY